MFGPQWEAATPVLEPAGQQAVRCWNFAGGWDVDKLVQAAIFYNVEDVDMLLRLCQALQAYLLTRQRDDGQQHPL